MKVLFSSFFCCLISFSGFACLNEYETTIDGIIIETEFSLPVFYRSFDTDFSQKFVDHYDLSHKETIPYEELSDVSVHLARLGRYEESLELLLWLNERHPDEYRICANLGTLYELNGNVDSALYFIKHAMLLNPESHNGSEWIHLAILKAKQKISRDKNWLNNHRVLDLNLNKSVPIDSEEYLGIMDTIYAITYQMHERVPFTPVPDPILADIFDEFGDILARHFSIREAYVAYNIALEYGSQERFGTNARLREIVNQLENSDDESFDQPLPKMTHEFPPVDRYEDIRDENLPSFITDTLNTGVYTMTTEFKDGPVINYAPFIWILIAVIAILLGLLVFKITR